MSATFNEMFVTNRKKLIGLAYRITGSRGDAEDIVNDAFLKWLHVDHSTIKTPDAWLTKVTTRLALDYLKSARVKRETYIGPWLPEPFIDENEMPDTQYEMDESVSIALMVLLETLSPGERAAFILHDIFHIEYDEIGKILNKPAATCRKMASRARDNIRMDVQKHLPASVEFEKMASAFFGAVKNGDMTDLISLLKDNVTFHADGGGKAAAALEVLEGKHTVAMFVLEKVRPAFTDYDTHKVEVKCTWFNGAPGFVIWVDDEPVSAFNFVIEDGFISKIFIHRNPNKLKFFSTVSEKDAGYISDLLV